MLKAYQFHGVKIEKQSGNEACATCPFCGKEGHFYINTGNGLWSCKKGCGEGNLYTFLARIHALYLEKTTKSDWKSLQNHRSIDWSILKEHQLAYTGSSWLLPIYNVQGALANLMLFPWTDKKPKLLSTPGCAQHLFNAHRVQRTGPVYICEGQWDAMALQWLLRQAHQDAEDYSVVGVPGASVFKADWVPLFQDRQVVLLYDHDEEGRRGMEKVASLLRSSSVRSIRWPANLPAKYDIRDFIAQHRESPLYAWQTLQAYWNESSPRKTRKPPSLRTLMREFRRHLHLTSSMETAIIVMLAVTLAARIPGDPLWLFLVGPPGCGKTLLIQTFSGAPAYTFSISKLTKSALISGFASSEDVSILPRLQGKCLFIKDYTAIKAMPTGVQEELYGILRDAYDGHVTVPFGNGIVRKYHKTYFSLIAGVTDIIHGDNRASLGERFLKLELLDDQHNDEQHILHALQEDAMQHAGDLQSVVADFLDRPVPEDRLPSIPAPMLNRIVSLSRIVSLLRATVHREDDTLLFRPRAEVGTRIAKQLSRLSRFVAIVLGQPRVNEKTYDIIRRVALDTVFGFNLEIAADLIAHPRGRLLADMEQSLQVSDSTIERRLHDLQELRIVYKTDVKSNGRGRPAFLWKLSSDVRRLWEKARITPKAVQHVHPPRAISDRAG